MYEKSSNSLLNIEVMKIEEKIESLDRVAESSVVYDKELYDMSNAALDKKHKLLLRIVSCDIQKN